MFRPWIEAIRLCGGSAPRRVCLGRCSHGSKSSARSSDPRARRKCSDLGSEPCERLVRRACAAAPTSWSMLQTASRDMILMASGSVKVHLVLEAREQIVGGACECPCCLHPQLGVVAISATQDIYRELSVIALGQGASRCGEAGVSQGWHRYVGRPWRPHRLGSLWRFSSRRRRDARARIYRENVARKAQALLKSHRRAHGHSA